MTFSHTFHMRRPAPAAPRVPLRSSALSQRAAKMVTARSAFSDEELRPVSNLKITHKFPAGEDRSGAMKFYRGAIKYGKRNINHALWTQAGMCVMFGGVQWARPNEPQMKKKQFRYLIVGEEAIIDSANPGLVSIKMESDGALVKMPAATFPKSHAQMAQFLPTFTAAEDPMRNIPFTENLITDGMFVPAKKLLALAKGSLAEAACRELADIPDAGIEFRNSGADWDLLVVVKFTRAQVSAMTQTDWLMVRPVDFFNMMHEWANTRMNRYGKALALFSMPLSRIAKTLPENGDPRVSEDLGIMIDEKADYWFLPKKANNITRYESEHLNQISRPDGSFSLMPLASEGDLRPTPPQSGLVLCDWTNYKMSYVNGEGRLEIKNTDRCIAALPQHYLRVLNFRLASDFAQNVWTQSLLIAQKVLNKTYSGQAYDLTFKFVVSAILSEITSDPENEGGQHGVEDLRMQDLYVYKNRIPVLQYFWEAIEEICVYSQTSIENLYSKYAFTTISQLVSSLQILTKIAPKRAELMAADRERQKAYQDRSVDPNYKIGELPLISTDPAGRAMMPHQTRVASRLRNSPPFAMIAVDAGGGKTISIISDFLKEFRDGTVKRGLIMCPPHLVAQYVKEFLYLTDSKVNVIAINTFTIKTHGIEGLRKLLLTAPPNSVVVTDYDLANSRDKVMKVCYGTQSSGVYYLVDMLRQFRFDYVAFDEAHYLKKSGAERTRAVARLTVDIPIKRLASGTMTPNSPMDIAGLAGLCDPTIFPVDDFEKTYKKETLRKGRKVMIYDTAAIRAKLEQDVAFVQIKRKEWAAWLPQLKERAHPAYLTPAQQAVYDTVLHQVMEEIQAKLASGNNTALNDLLLGVKKGEDDDDEGAPAGKKEDDDDSSPDDGVDIDSLLNPMLFRLESFSSNPAGDVYGGTVLTGDDRISPKVGKMVEIIRDHIDAGIQGKILVFCNYNQEVDGIMEALPEDIRAMTVHYVASDKAACAAEFESNPNMMVMIGIEVSMNTGLNLQFCSRLIRMSTVWTPGALEQGNARVQRPNLKSAENRANVFIDWVVCDRTIDVTKQAYLLTKVMHIGKFDEATNPLFAEIKPPPLQKMSLANIANSNTASAVDVQDVYDTYKEFKDAQFEDYRQFRDKNKADVGPDGRPQMQRLIPGPNPEGSKLMYRIPYVPGLDLFKTEDLGLKRYDHLLRLNEAELADDSDDADDEKGDSATMTENQKMRGMGVHTEFGEGIIVRVNKKKINVQLTNGSVVTVRKLAAFVITRKQTNAIDMRAAILNQIEGIPNDAPVSVPAKGKPKVKKEAPKVEEPKARTAASIKFALEIVVVNDFLGVQFKNAVKNSDAAEYLEGRKFGAPPEFFYAEMKTPDVMLRQFTKWKDAGFSVDKAFSTSCHDLYENFIKRKASLGHMVGLATKAELTNFVTMKLKPTNNKLLLKPYPVVTEGQVLLALPATGHPASVDAITKRVPGMVWKKVAADSIRQRFFTSPDELAEVMRGFIADGVTITNLDELRTGWAALMARRKKMKI